MKTEVQIQKTIDKIAAIRDFDKKYFKNIIIDICHGQSTDAHRNSCSICGVTAHTKAGWKKGISARSYGIRFGDWYNKRAQCKKTFSTNYFLTNVCGNCIDLLQKKLDYNFKKSYAP